MTNEIKDQWYYIVVQNPGTPNEEFLGYEDGESGDTFLPAFNSKEEASQCFLMMPKDAINHKYEVQAMIKDDLMALSRDSDFKVFLLDDKGVFQEEIC